MITKDFILSKLPPYTGSKKVLIDELELAYQMLEHDIGKDKGAFK